LIGDTLLLLFNAHHEPIPFQLPTHNEGQAWDFLFDTSEPSEPTFHDTNIRIYQLQPRSMAVLRTIRVGPGTEDVS
jgi:isoamylase